MSEMGRTVLLGRQCRPPHGVAHHDAHRVADKGGAVTDQARHRFWLLLCCAGFAILSFTTKPGHLIPDTKLDLALDPIGWLEREIGRASCRERVWMAVAAVWDSRRTARAER